MLKGKIAMYVLMTALTGSLGLLGKAGCDRHKLQSANDELNKQLMEADLKLGRALTQFGDAKEHIDRLGEDIQEEISKRKAVATRYGELKLRYKMLRRKRRGRKTEVVYKDKIIEIPTELELDPGMYYEATTRTALRPLKSIHGMYQDYHIQIVSRLIPHPTAQDGTQWEFDYELDMRYELQIVETHLPSGGINHYASMWEVDEKGERVEKLEITDFVVVVNRPDGKQWFWWAPHVDIGVLAGANLAVLEPLLGGSVGFSPFGYGLTTNDLDWRFLRVSFDLGTSLPGFGISPVMWNLGGSLPLLSNLWVAPHVSYLPPEGWALSLFTGAML